MSRPTPSHPTDAPPVSADTACYRYDLLPGAWDELWDAGGRIRKPWEPFVRALESRGCDELERCRTDATRLLKQNGIAYHIHGNPQGVHRQWKLDVVPMILSREDWQRVESGLQQRAYLLEQILEDIYGKQTLVKEGLLPPQIVFRHPGFQRSCFDLRRRGRSGLFFYGADLVRNHAGEIRVLADHSQRPAGLGYCLENRTVMAKVMPDFFRECRVQRLSNFFRQLRQALSDIAPFDREEPHVVVLTPGPHEGAYFEHAYLANYLGYTVCQGEDLTVRDGSVWLKSIEGLKRVDVVLRQIEDADSDPLELGGASSAGVPGLLEASRSGHVAVANQPGCGLLENPALMAFLPDLARRLTGADLILPSVRTWWCGREEDRRRVLDGMDRMILKPIFRKSPVGSVFGARLGARELDAWRKRLHTDPGLYVAQEPLTFSTAPILADRRFEPRHGLLRTFVIAPRNGDPIVMPGGIVRCTLDWKERSMPASGDGILKDAWVIASIPQKHVSLWLQSGMRDPGLRRRGVLSSRAAENLFWVGRYAERTEAVARMLRTVLVHLTDSDRFEDEAADECLKRLNRSLIDMTVAARGKDDPPEERPHSFSDDLATVIQEADHPGSLCATMNFMVNAAYGVREYWSADTWQVINAIEDDRQAVSRQSGFFPNFLLSRLDSLIRSLQAFSGLCMESMSRELGWLLLDTGRRIERALVLSEFIRRNLAPAASEPVEHLMMESVLTTAENIITYRRRYRTRLRLGAVLDLLLMDEKNPRSLVYQIDGVQKHIAELPRKGGYPMSEEERLVLMAVSRLKLSQTVRLSEVDPSAGSRKRLANLLIGLRVLLEKTSEALSRSYFIHTQKVQQIASEPGDPL